MPRRPRLTAGGLVCHVLNRRVGWLFLFETWARVGWLFLFETWADYLAVKQIVSESVATTRLRIASYCVVPNHWHLLLWPRQGGEPSDVLRWIMRKKMDILLFPR